MYYCQSSNGAHPFGFGTYYHLILRTISFIHCLCVSEMEFSISYWVCDILTNIYILGSNIRNLTLGECHRNWAFKSLTLILRVYYFSCNLHFSLQHHGLEKHHALTKMLLCECYSWDSHSVELAVGHKSKPWGAKTLVRQEQGQTHKK